MNVVVCINRSNEHKHRAIDDLLSFDWLKVLQGGVASVSDVHVAAYMIIMSTECQLNGF